MPGGDGTGPNGMGPRTGRGMGFCNGYNSEGYANPSFQRRGFGRRMGRGRGFGFRRFWNTQPKQPSKEQQKQQLELDLKELEEDQELLNKERDELHKRLEELG